MQKRNLPDWVLILKIKRKDGKHRTVALLEEHADIIKNFLKEFKIDDLSMIVSEIQNILFKNFNCRLDKKTIEFFIKENQQRLKMEGCFSGIKTLVELKGLH